MDNTNIHPAMLTKLQLFRGLDTEQHQSIAHYCRKLNFTAGDYIIRLNEESNDVFFLAEGQVKVTVYSQPGRQITLQTLTPGACFGEVAALDRQPRSAYVIALTDCIVISMSADAFLEILQRYPSVALATIGRLCHMIRNLSLKTHMRNALSARARVYAELLRLAMQEKKRHHNRACLSKLYTHSELASFAGTTRETVSREIAHLKSLGLIDTSKRTIEITNIAKLAHMLD